MPHLLQDKLLFYFPMDEAGMEMGSNVIESKACIHACIRTRARTHARVCKDVLTISSSAVAGTILVWHAW